MEISLKNKNHFCHSIFKKATSVILICLFLVITLACRRSKDSSLIKNKNEASSTGPQTYVSSFLLITIDTWRWDYIGVSGSGKVETPNLDKLAKEGVYEKMAETPIPLTTPAHTTIMTGLLPLNHKVIDVSGYKLSEKIPVVAEEFEKKGYGRAAFVSSVTLDKRYGLNRGFEIYDSGNIDEKTDINSESPERNGEDTTYSFLNYLKREKANRPLFVWIHYYDAHWPYRSRAEYDAKYLSDPYAAQVAFVDSQIGIVKDAIEKDKQRDWKVIIVGDYGEGLNDHGERRHGLSLYSEVLNVPLIFWPKPEKPFLHSKPWRLEDIYPTVVEWLGLDSTAKTDGENLFLNDNNSREREVSSITIVPFIKFGVAPVLGMRKGKFMYIRQGDDELYDLDTDPQEKMNLISKKEYLKISNELRQLLDRALPFDEIKKCVNMVKETKKEELEQLESLGYIGGNTPTSMPYIKNAKMKDLFKCETMIEDAYETYKKDKDFDKLRNAYEKLLKEFPSASLYAQKFGQMLIEREDFEGAERAYKLALSVNPNDHKILVNLSAVEITMKKIDDGKVLLEKALEIDPNDAAAHKNLGIIYSTYLNDPQKAVEHFKKYLELGPDSDAEMIQDYVVNNSR